MAMQQRYFKLNEADSVKYHKEYLEKIGNPRKKAIRDFLSACNAVGYLSHQHFGTEHISALLVRGGVDCGRNKRISSKKFDDDGQALFEVRPDRRYSEGKQLATRLKEINEKLQALPSFSAWAVGALGCYADAFYVNHGQQFTTWSAAGFFPEKKALVVRIPVGESGKQPLPGDMSPALIEIKRSEFIAITEE
ncbi:hypothetical protein CTX76_000201 [Salmonella enterica subsp. houtenae]|nr:hypothetical protein [Salmonella enterica subsp. enterica serovar Braenderup]EBS5150239.1 hypothetical protein [Salmonella enterica subsp. enterica serovar Monschaui]EBZ4113987.1 hypothetical protein [Salmonella enterica subsp. enterica serovar Montevideo]ECD5510697.1 hypothetical protein [Salmonella enterica subsp. enterica serovar Minnesota]ECD9304247.1 hypothetical protein [Salmonella enterica subsp. salamae]ECF0245472.1 hypothetical protein [Salmonella enterica subsp. enterica serovar G